MPELFNRILTIVSFAEAVGLAVGAAGKRRRPWTDLACYVFAGMLAITSMPAPAGAGPDVDAVALARIRNPPTGLPRVPVPGDNPPTKAKINLGRKLFFDRRLSANATMSCAMCHIPEQGFTNNEMATAIGVEGRSLKRNAPTILNAAYQRSMFHDGRDTTLETQIFGPLLARAEMANASVGRLIARIRELPDYAGRFEAAFGTPANVLNLGQAIACYERSALSANSPFDRWYFGHEGDAMSRQAQRGFQMFIGKARCAECHMIGADHALFSDNALHNTGIGYRRDVIEPARRDPVSVEIAPGVVVGLARRVVEVVGEVPPKDLGRMEVTGDPRDLYRFKTASLRNVALTAPYMHDGSLATLADVVDFYNRGGVANPGLDPLIKPLGLEPAEQKALVAFLENLTGDNIAELIADARNAPVGN